MKNPSLKVALCGLSLRTPIMTASGTFGYGLEYHPLVDFADLGAVVVKGTTLEPWLGNRPPRILETPSGMLNAIGLENCGVEAFIHDKLPKLTPYDLPIVVNIAGRTVDEYPQVIEHLEKAQGIAAYELNISCPNVRQGGMAFGTDPETAASVTRAAKAIASRPVIVKLSPNVTDITAIAQAVEAAGADAISLVNTFVGMAIDIHKRRPVLGNKIGGLSGPCIRPLAVRMVWQVAQAVRVPVIGMGGIDSWQSALEFILAGADAVGIGTAVFVNPGIARDINQGLLDYMQKEGIDSISQLVGAAWK
jgi:dihydroorotate dehydrogenase (NAD+) catalytic subunit